MKHFLIYPSPEKDPTGFAHIFRDELRAQGFDETLDFEKADIIYAFDHPRLFSKTLLALKTSKAQKVLLRFEPPAVNPILYSKNTLRHYGRVLSIGGTKHLGVSDQVIHWPYFSHPNPAKPKQDDILESKSISFSSFDGKKDRRIELSMIVSNKVAWSKPSNYTLRRNIILKATNFGLSCYGMGWQSSRLFRLATNLRLYLFFLSQRRFVNPIHMVENFFFPKQESISAIANKFDVLTNSDFHLVIENSSTYVSEKLLDALVAGAVPIYIGPDLKPYGIPASCVITPKNDIGEVVKTLQNLKDVDLEAIREQVSKFMHSDKGLGAWEPSKVAQSIIGICR
jgi:hypothetical protein